MSPDNWLLVDVLFWTACIAFALGLVLGASQ